MVPYTWPCAVRCGILFSVVPAITFLIFRDAEPIVRSLGVRQMDIHPGWDASLGHRSPDLGAI